MKLHRKSLKISIVSACAGIAWLDHCEQSFGSYLGQSIAFPNPACTGLTQITSAIRKGRITVNLESDGIVRRSISSDGVQFVVGKEGCRYAIAIGKPMFVRESGGVISQSEYVSSGLSAGVSIWPQSAACDEIQVNLVLAEYKVDIAISWPARIGDRQFQGAALTAELIRFTAGTTSCVVQYEAAKIP